MLQDHVSRQVPLGIFTDQNKGDSNGHALALALRGGWDFHVGAFTFGPLAGLTLQQVRFNGFTESGTTGVTALSFGAQTRNSAISQLGVRASTEIGDWRPFAELAWNHELADRNRTVTASLTSIAAPAYFAAAIPGALDWASASAGTSYRINARSRATRRCVRDVHQSSDEQLWRGGVAEHGLLIDMRRDAGRRRTAD